MPHEYPRSLTMSRTSKMRGSQHSERDVSPSVQRRALQQMPLPGSMAILWDMENCPVPSDVKADDVAGNVRMALRQFSATVTFFSAYGDFNHFQKKVREGCQRTGVNLIDVPNGKKDASDKAILVDLFLFALDNRPPCTIFLISGDVDFAPALHKLGQRGYTVVLAIPSGVGVSSALFSAGRHVWDWPSVARGGGLVVAKNFPAKVAAEDRMADMLASARGGGEDRTAGDVIASSRARPDDRMSDVMPSRASSAAERLAERLSLSRPPVENRTHEIIELHGYAGPVGPAWGPSDDSDLAGDDPVPDEEEKIVWKTSDPRRIPDSNSGGNSGPLKGDPPQKGTIGSSAPPSSSPGKPPQAVNPVGARGLGNQAIGAISGVKGPGDAAGSTVLKGGGSGGGSQTSPPTANLQALKDQLVSLLSLHGSKLELARVPAEYEKHYGKPLYAEYVQTGTKLVERFRETVSVKGEGPNKVLHLTKTVKAKLKRDAKNARAVQREEIEASEAAAAAAAAAAKFRAEDVASPEDEMAGEQVVAAFANQALKASVDEVKSPPAIVKQPQLAAELAETPEELQSPVYDSGCGSTGSGGSGDEKDGDPQEEKDVEVDELTLERVGKRERKSAELDILDVFRVEVEELLVSNACKIPRNAFEDWYKQRYSKDLDYGKFGASDLEALIGKVSDVAVMLEDAGSKDKYLVAS